MLGEQAWSATEALSLSQAKLPSISRLSLLGMEMYLRLCFKMLGPRGDASVYGMAWVNLFVHQPRRKTVLICGQQSKTGSPRNEEGDQETTHSSRSR